MMHVSVWGCAPIRWLLSLAFISWCIYSTGLQWLLESADDHIVCVFQVNVAVGV